MFSRGKRREINWDQDGFRADLQLTLHEENWHRSEVILGMGPDRVGEFWVDQLVRARARPPRKLPSPRLMVRVVSQLKGSIGYVPIERLTADVKVVATVRGGKVVPK